MSDIAIIEKESIDIIRAAETIIIENQEDYSGAGAFLKKIKVVMKRVDNIFDPIISTAFRSHKQATTTKNERKKPLEDAERIIKRKMQVFFADQEKKRLEEEERLLKEAQAKAENEKIEAAGTLLDNGDVEAALEMIETPTIVPDVPAQEKITAAGVNMVKVWKFRIVDKAAVPEIYKLVDVQAVGGVVRALKDKTSIPGIEVYFEHSARA